MAWTAPRTWATSELVTALLLNAQLRDNLLILKTNIADDGSITAGSVLEVQVFS